MFSYCDNHQGIGTHFLRGSLVVKMTSTQKVEKDKSCESSEEEENFLSEVAREDFIELNLGCGFVDLKWIGN